MQNNTFKKKSGVNSYKKWGYIFLIPFFLIYITFSFIPLITTFYYSFFERYMSGLRQVGPNFIGLKNYKTIFSNGDMLKYINNTFVMWILGFVPQILIALLLANWFTDRNLRLKGLRFFKTVIYLPNLIMASAFAMLFFTIFSDAGPINNIFINIGILKEPVKFLSETWTTRGLVSLMNFLMWFGNTTILLMAGIMTIDASIIEAAQVDGATSRQTFSNIILPLLKPILLYVLIISMIGGLQMFDVPQILTDGKGTPNRTTMTLIMYLNNHLFSKNYGMAGALSVVFFAITSILSVFLFRFITIKKD